MRKPSGCLPAQPPRNSAIGDERAAGAKLDGVARRSASQALGVLEASRSAIDELLKITPADMTNEQLEVALAFCKRQLALWGGAEAKRSLQVRLPAPARTSSHSAAF